jgi:hypothetical protein
LPNTLIHIAIQAPLSRAVYHKAAIPWILAGIIIPDIPWIFQRIFYNFPLVDPFHLRLYTTVQASLLFCLLFSWAVTAFAKRPGPVFLLVGSNCLLHLILDALQIKWGNGVHLLAPFSWQTIDLGIIWPEHYAGYIFSGIGIVYLLFMWRTTQQEGLALSRSPRWKSAIVCLAIYIFSPFVFMEQQEKSNTNFIQLKKDAEIRSGQSIELDRVSFEKETSTVTIFAREKLSATGALPQQSGTISLKGRFLSPDSLHIEQFHIHNSYRFYASQVGLFLVLLIWLNLLISRRFPPNSSEVSR